MIIDLDAYDELSLQLGKIVALSSIVLGQLENYTFTTEKEKLVPAAVMEGLALIAEDINGLAVEAQEKLSAGVQHEEVTSHA